MKKTTKPETTRIKTNLNGVSYIVTPTGQRVEIVGEIVKIRRPDPRATNPVGNLILRIAEQPDDLYLEAQLWKQSLGAITGIVGVYNADKSTFEDRKAPYTAQTGDIVKITGTPKFENPLRDGAGKIMRRPTGEPIRKLTVITNFLKQLELVARYRATIPEAPADAPADAPRKKAQQLPTEF